MSQLVVIETHILSDLIKEAVKETLLNILPREEKTKEFLNTKEVAKMLSITENALRCQRMQRKGLPFLKSGKRVLYRYQDIIDYLEAHRVKIISE